MTVAQLVEPHLPYLRRFSRALSGSQKSGDSYVEAMLETVVVDPSTVTNGANPRVALYGLLCGLWESVGLNLAAVEPADHWEKAAQAKLAGIAPRPRQAFLLTAVEGFSIPEAAEVLRTDKDGVTELLDEAAREIGEMMATDVLIIAFTISGAKGLVMRKVGSGRLPVSRRSGNAVMKITGASKPASRSLTASMPELPSASWMSARMMPGRLLAASLTASLRVRATPVTR